MYWLELFDVNIELINKVRGRFILSCNENQKITPTKMNCNAAQDGSLYFHIITMEAQICCSDLEVTIIDGHRVA